MLDVAPALAVLRHGADIDLTAYRAALLESIQCEPIDPFQLDGDLRHAPVLFLISVPWWRQQTEGVHESLFQQMLRASSAVILAGEPGEDVPPEIERLDITTGWIDLPPGGAALRGAVMGALRTVKMRIELQETQRQLKQRMHEMREITRVGMALSAEKDLEALQHMILRTAREMTNADAGTLYLVRENADKQKVLIFQYTQNDSINAPYQRQEMPISMKSISGYVAATGQIVRIADAYNLSPEVEYSINPSFDRTFGYRTRSLLAVPMRNHENAIVGVIQLINRKRSFETRLTSAEVVEEEVEPFAEEHANLLSSFASQAAVALENKVLLESIQNLFAAFVHASVTAIEARDPTTFGHSDRVARLTVDLATAINDTHVGQWQGLHFTEPQLKEIQYAGLLHDFGKVGVREHVLVKPKKLYDWKLQEVRSRFHIARELVENQYLRRQLELALTAGAQGYATQEPVILAERERDLTELDEMLRAVLQANEPSVLEEDRFALLMKVAARTMLTPEGDVMPLITEDEFRALSIRRGTLDEEERREIESHVTHSFNFLIQIPWTKDLDGIPNIAYAHHEKLNGSGYPRRLLADEIPVQAKMMTIADIFDALTATDRPYKPAVPLHRALDILGYEAKDGNIDRDLLDLFIERKVYRRVLDPRATVDRALRVG